MIKNMNVNKNIFVKNLKYLITIYSGTLKLNPRYLGTPVSLANVRYGRIWARVT